MSVAQHRTRDDWAADAIQPSTLARQSYPALGQPDAQASLAALTADDEALLKELECSDSTFINLLVDEVWDDAGWLRDSAPTDQEPEGDRAVTELVSRLSDPSELSAQKIVNDWALALIDSGVPQGSRRCGGRSGTPYSSLDYYLLYILLDFDDATHGDHRCLGTTCDRHPPDPSGVCDSSLHRTLRRMGCNSLGSVAGCDAWTRFLEGGLSPRRIVGRSRLWSMVDEVAKSYRLVPYDRENVLRILLGDLGNQVFFAGIDNSLFPDEQPDDCQSRPQLLKDIGASVIGYFYEWSLITGLLHGRHLPHRLNGGLSAADPLECGIWAGAITHAPLSNGLCESFRPAPRPSVMMGESRMPKLTFYPVGNADTFVIDLTGGEKIIFDYADRRNPDDENDRRCDLPAELRKDLDAAERKHYDVAVFTHLDEDHYDGMTEFFYMEHDKAYQGKVGGKDRVKMSEMWVPAAVLTEKLKEDESKVIQKEARHRLRNKKGILVFSRPDSLKSWLKQEGIDFEAVRHLIIDAGRTVPTFSQDAHGVEFWVHSPHATRQNKDEVVIRNDHALALLAAFKVGDVETKVQLFADVKLDIIADIVNVTQIHKNDHRLEWDVFKLPHHCSYLSLGPDKGENKTQPIEEVAWLFKDQGRAGSIVVSASDPIPKKGSKEDESNQPPHRQAANYYREIVQAKDGEFVVTMEHPKVSGPKPLVIEIDQFKATVKKEQVVGAAALTSVNAPRAG
jgi:beta-lactamase superfamily II metal-dependent hydrolase